MRFEFFFDSRRTKDYWLWIREIKIKGESVEIDIQLKIPSTTITIYNNVEIESAINAYFKLSKQNVQIINIDINTITASQKPVKIYTSISPYIRTNVNLNKSLRDSIEINTKGHVYTSINLKEYVHIGTIISYNRSNIVNTTVDMNITLPYQRSPKTIINLDILQRAYFNKPGTLLKQSIGIIVKTGRNVSQKSTQSIELYQKTISQKSPKTSINLDILQRAYFNRPGTLLKQSIGITAKTGRNVSLRPSQLVELYQRTVSQRSYKITELMRINTSLPYQRSAKTETPLALIQTVYFNRPGGLLRNTIIIDTKTGRHRTRAIPQRIDMYQKTVSQRSYKITELMRIDTSLHSDFSNHGDTQHSDVAFINFSNHSDRSFSNWSNHSDRAHSDILFSNFSNHSNYLFSNWSDHSNRAHSDVRFSNWSNHANYLFSNWLDHSDRSHSDRSFSNWSNHSDRTHSDVAFSNWSNHGDRAHSDIRHSDAIIMGKEVMLIDESKNTTWYHSDIIHSDISFINWLDHSDRSHSDRSFSNWSNHSDRAHSDVAFINWSNHSDRTFSNFSNHSDRVHSDVAFIDWSNHSDYPFTDFTNHSDRVHSDRSFSNWSNHSDRTFSNWSNHSDRAHSDRAHSDFNRHSDIGN